MDFVHPIRALIPGVTGHILEALVQAGQDLTLTALSQVADVSPAQASRVLPRLQALGVVERRDVRPASLFRLVDGHVAVRSIRTLASARQRVLALMREQTAKIRPRPANVTVFGSFAEGTARADSDIDVLVVRAASVDASDEQWNASLSRWTDKIGRASGNPVNLLEVEEGEIPRLLRSGRGPWKDIRDSGAHISGDQLEVLAQRGA